MAQPSHVRSFASGDEAAIGEIMARSIEADRLPGFRPAEIDRSVVRIGADPDGTAVAVEDGVVVGYCTPVLDDLTVHPDHRGRGHGTRLVSAAQRIERDRGRQTLTLYVPLHLPPSIAFAERHGFHYHSSLWQFILPEDTAVPGPVFAPDVVPSVVDPRDIEDVAGWVSFLLTAFEGHPSPMSWTEEGMRRLHGSPGFDGSGFLVVAAATAPDEPIAFTRIESYAEGSDVGGEIGLIGVVPAWRRRGLGRELLRWGVAELRGRGAGAIELTVEAANEQATQLYQAHGFVATVEWPHWRVPVDQVVG